MVHFPEYYNVWPLLLTTLLISTDKEHSHGTHIFYLVICYGVGMGAFLNQGQDFAGFFSLDGVQFEGCLSYGFGIALAAFIINVIATVAGVVAICYKKLVPTRYKYTIKKTKTNW